MYSLFLCLYTVGRLGYHGYRATTMEVVFMRDSRGSTLITVFLFVLLVLWPLRWIVVSMAVVGAIVVGIKHFTMNKGEN